MAFLNNFRFLTCIDILVCHEITIYIYTSSFFAGFLLFLFWNMYVGGALHRHVEGVTSLRRQYNKKGESFFRAGVLVVWWWWWGSNNSWGCAACRLDTSAHARGNAGTWSSLSSSITLSLQPSSYFTPTKRSISLVSQPLSCRRLARLISYAGWNLRVRRGVHVCAKPVFLRTNRPLKKKRNDRPADRTERVKAHPSAALGLMRMNRMLSPPNS